MNEFGSQPHLAMPWTMAPRFNATTPMEGIVSNQQREDLNTTLQEPPEEPPEAEDEADAEDDDDEDTGEDDSTLELREVMRDLRLNPGTSTDLKLSITPFLATLIQFNSILATSLEQLAWKQIYLPSEACISLRPAPSHSQKPTVLSHCG